MSRQHVEPILIKARCSSFRIFPLLMSARGDSLFYCLFWSLFQRLQPVSVNYPRPTSRRYCLVLFWSMFFGRDGSKHLLARFLLQYPSRLGRCYYEKEDEVRYSDCIHYLLEYNDITKTNLVSSHRGPDNLQKTLDDMHINTLFRFVCIVCSINAFTFWFENYNGLHFVSFCKTAMLYIK